MIPCNLYCFFSVIGVGLFDYLYFTKGLSIYEGAIKFGVGAVAVSISACIVTAPFCLKTELKDYYCSHCRLTNVLRFSHDQNMKEIYGYKFETHAAHTEKVKIKEAGEFFPSYTVEYRVPEYQENLGLHKTTTKETVYICENCGRTTIKNSSNTEKVDMD